jgi:hypothetical protein
MRQEFSDRLKVLIHEKFAGSWKDGWVYGRLKQDLDLQPDELNVLAATLGFKYGWNHAVKDILENQWQEDEVTWMQRELNKVQKQVSLNRQKVSTSQKMDILIEELKALENKPRQEFTDIEQALIALILKMKFDEQLWMLETIFNRYNS